MFQLFVFDYKVLSVHCEGDQRILKGLDPKMPQSVQRKRLTWFLKLSTKNSLLHSITMEMQANILLSMAVRT